MTFKNEHKDIESRFQTQWGSTTPVAYDNIEFTPVSGTAYVRLHISTGDQIPVSLGGIGATQYRGVGTISVNIYIPLNIGGQTGKDLADTAAAIFRGQTFSGITCRGAEVTDLGERNGWYVYNVSIPFFRDEIF